MHGVTMKFIDAYFLVTKCLQVCAFLLLLITWIQVLPP